MSKFERNIVLTGFMGTGKTSVAKALAKKLNFKLIDTDQVIELETKKSITEIFAQHGEEYFRNLENKLCENLHKQHNLVISTGGKTLIRMENWDYFNTNSTIICLTATLKTIKLRTGKNKHRPLLQPDKLSRLLQDRKCAYQRTFHQIATDDLTINEIVAIIVKIAKTDKSIHKNALWVKMPSAPPYPILVKENILTDIGTVLRWSNCTAKKVAIVTNKIVGLIYANTLELSLQAAGFETVTVHVPDGEDHKTLATVEQLYQDFAEHDISRNDTVLALGGGVTGDIAGFAAATYLRGLNFIQVPTTLLAMVDSSVGGKTGVDLPQGKNLVGTFKQPSLVLIDPLALKTLPEIEFNCGLAEIVKHALIDGNELFNLLQTSNKNNLNLSDLIKNAVKVKIAIVEQDPLEQNIRSLLNLGHTFAHAIEKVSNYKVKHGQAVAIGIVAAAHLSSLLNLCPKALPQQIIDLLLKWNLPTSFSKLSIPELAAAMQHDKKRANKKLRCVLLNGIGEAILVTINDPKLINQALILVKT